MAWVSTTYAWRSLGRHRRRTVLSVIGIGVGCALALFMESMNRGRDELFARMGAYAGAGHVRIVPAGWNALAYCIQGGIKSGIQGGVFTAEADEDGQSNAPALLPARHMAQFADDGEGIVLCAASDSATDSDTQVLILAGAPLEGPVVSWGPFVMGSREEILQAQQDYLAGRMGRLGGVPF